MRTFELSGYFNGHQHYKKVLRFFEAVKIIMSVKKDEEIKVKRS